MEEYWKKVDSYLNGTGSVEELSQVTNNEVIEDQLDKKTLTAIEESSKMVVPEKSSKDAIWDKIQSTVEEKNEEPVVKTVQMSFYRVMSVAAAILLLLGGGWYYLSLEKGLNQTWSAQVKETKEVSLPDGSMVTLNANSSLEAQDFNDHHREVFLKGEAFFDIEKGQPFIIHTQEGVVKVLGTSFNVKARSSGFEVKCKTGKVQVELLSSDSKVVLTAGQATKVNRNLKLEKYAVTKLEEVGAWQQGWVNYEGVPVKQVLADVEDQFGVIVETIDVENRAYSGSVYLTNLEGSLKSICASLSLTYSKEGKKITIKPGK